MRKYLLIFALPVLLLSFCGQKAPVVDVAAEKNAVKAVLDNYVKSVVDEDMDLYAQQVSQDSQMIYIGGGISLSWIEGWDALKKVMEGQNLAFDSTNIEVTQEKIFVSPTGQTAWAATQWNLNTMIGGEAYSLPLRCTWILEKQNQSWIVVHFHKSFGVASLENYKITGDTSGDLGI